jgi:hypothetical protein
LLHMILAGEILIDASFARRGLILINVQKKDGNNIEILFPAISPALLRGVRGLNIALDHAVIDLIIQHQSALIENALLKLLATIQMGERPSFIDKPLVQLEFGGARLFDDDFPWIRHSRYIHDKDYIYASTRHRQSAALFMAQFSRGSDKIMRILEKYSEFDQAIRHPSRGTGVRVESNLNNIMEELSSLGRDRVDVDESWRDIQTIVKALRNYL